MTTDQLTHQLVKAGVHDFFGVPDSVLMQFSTALNSYGSAVSHSICANEGGAIAQAMGSFLASGRIAVAYMQNSGLGNALNPLVSMASVDAASIPLVIVIGWRGEPGTVDEPQHLHQGRITQQLLTLLDVPFWIMDETSDFTPMVRESLEVSYKRRGPVALLVRRQSKDVAQIANLSTPSMPIFSRRQALTEVMNAAPSDAAFICTTGYTSREAYEEFRARSTLQRALYVVGAMGHANSIALAIARKQPERLVVCLDGDGAMFMHLGNLAQVTALHRGRFIHIVVHNGCHESVGGHPTVAPEIDLTRVAAALGYNYTVSVNSAAALREAFYTALTQSGASFLRVVVGVAPVGRLARPDQSPSETTKDFQTFLLTSCDG